MWIYKQKATNWSLSYPTLSSTESAYHNSSGWAFAGHPLCCLPLWGSVPFFPTLLYQWRVLSGFYTDFCFLIPHLSCSALCTCTHRTPNTTLIAQQSWHIDVCGGHPLWDNTMVSWLVACQLYPMDLRRSELIHVSCCPAPIRVAIDCKQSSPYSASFCCFSECAPSF